MPWGVTLSPWGRVFLQARDSSLYLVRKTIQRHKAACGVAFVFILVVLAGGITALQMENQRGGETGDEAESK